MNTILKELGRPPEEIYDNLSPDPIAAASLGQVNSPPSSSNSPPSSSNSPPRRVIYPPVGESTPHVSMYPGPAG
eukprot:4667126-Pyramimonas_sp.AAC.1